MGDQNHTTPHPSDPNRASDTTSRATPSPGQNRRRAFMVGIIAVLVVAAAWMFFGGDATLIEGAGDSVGVSPDDRGEAVGTGNDSN